MSTEDISPSARKLLTAINGCSLSDNKGMCSITTKGFVVWREHKLHRSQWSPLKDATNHMESAAEELVKSGKCEIVMDHNRHRIITV